MLKRLFGTRASILVVLCMLLQPASAFASVPPCTTLENGTGTTDLPPAGCGYLTPVALMQIINGLPAGTTIDIGPQLQEFFNVTHSPGGSLGGEVQQFGCFMLMRMSGTGTLAGYNKTVNMQMQAQTHSAPRTPGANIQSFDTDVFSLQGQLPPFGDPDFDLLRVTAGTAFGMPSPGHTTLTKVPHQATYNVHSFFDVIYRIDFIGHPGGPLSGRSGSTTDTIRFETGQPTMVGVPVDLPDPVLKLVNRPNPFVTGTTMEYRLPSAAHVRLSVHDATGHLVRTLTDEYLAEGLHAMPWNGRDHSGLLLPSGIYFVRFAIDGKVLTTSKVALLK